jgi:hypothetical protein
MIGCLICRARIAVIGTYFGLRVLPQSACACRRVARLAWPERAVHRERDPARSRVALKRVGASPAGHPPAARAAAAAGNYAVAER